MKLAAGQVWKGKHTGSIAEIVEVSNRGVEVYWVESRAIGKGSAFYPNQEDLTYWFNNEFQLVEWCADFDRFDICEAYQVLEWGYHKNGWLQERPSNQRRREAISVQLARLQFKPSPMLGSFEDLTDNGRAIYWNAVKRLGLSEDYS